MKLHRLISHLVLVIFGFTTLKSYSAPQEFRLTVESVRALELALLESFPAHTETNQAITQNVIGFIMDSNTKSLASPRTFIIRGLSDDLNRLGVVLAQQIFGSNENLWPLSLTDTEKMALQILREHPEGGILVIPNMAEIGVSANFSAQRFKDFIYALLNDTLLSEPGMTRTESANSLKNWIVIFGTNIDIPINEPFNREFLNSNFLKIRALTTNESILSEESTMRFHYVGDLKRSCEERLSF